MPNNTFLELLINLKPLKLKMSSNVMLKTLVKTGLILK